MILAERVLGDQQGDNASFMKALQEAFRDCPLHHKQDTLPFLDPLDDSILPPSKSAPPSPNREPRPRVELAPPLQIRVEVWRDSKNKRRNTRVVKL